MNDSWKKIRVAIGSLCVLSLLLVGSLFFLRKNTPLSVAEQQLVGDWFFLELHQDSEPDFVQKFLADRSFRTNDGQFFGKWSIQSGKLHLDYTKDKYWNWKAYSLYDLVLKGLNSEPVNRHKFDMTIDDDGKRLVFSEPEMPFGTLIRCRD